LAGGYHLDRYARIIKIADPPAAGSRCDRFRPYWAADIEILTPEGEPAKDFPRCEAVPLPLPMGGNDEGFFLWPRPGTIVTVRWIEGRPDHPVIQHIYPMGLSLPSVPDDMSRWQQRPGVHQYVCPEGNWERQTNKDIRDIAENIHETAGDSRTESTGGSSTENVGEVKSVSAGSRLKMTAPKISLSAPDGGPSILPLLSKALEDIQSALDTLAYHTHPNTGTCSQSSSVSSRANGVGSANTDLKTLQ